MSSKTATIGIVAILATLAVMPLPAQAPSVRSDPGLMAAGQAAAMTKLWLTKAADQMSEADYAFRQTPEVRSFGQLLAHVADLNYHFCACGIGAQQPVPDVEKNSTARTDIQQAVSASFAYCEGVYADMTEAKARTMVKLMGSPMPALAVLIYRTHHLSLHYGNVVTYMRLRGRVPPSTGGAAGAH